MTITISTTIIADIQKVWQFWTNTEHIVNWYFATLEWHCPSAEQNFIIGGKFNYRMEAKDGSFGFDYTGTFTQIIVAQLLEYTLDDNRKVSIQFVEENGQTKIIETFEIEDVNSAEMQRLGWQAILDNFKNYVEQN